MSQKFFQKIEEKKILEIFISIFKKQKKMVQKKKSVKCRLIHRFQNGKLFIG